MKLHYVYNPYDVRIDNSSLLEKLGQPLILNVLERGIVSSKYIIDEGMLTNDDYEIVDKTSLDPVEVSCITITKPTPEQYQSAIKGISFMTSKILGVTVIDVDLEIYYSNHGYVSTYMPIGKDGRIYPSSPEEGMNLPLLCANGTDEPLVQNHLFAHHSLIECAMADITQNTRYDLLTKDKITYTVPVGKEYDDILTIRMISSIFARDGTVCLPRIKGDPRIELFIEIANQWNFEVDRTKTGKNDAISIFNNDSEIPGHIWFEESASRISIGKIPLYHMHILPMNRPEEVASMKYAAISSYLKLCRSYDDLYRHIGEVNVNFDGSVVIPVCNRKQIDLFTKTMQAYIDADPIYSVGKFEHVDDALIARWYFSRMNMDTLLIESHRQLFVVGLFDQQFPGADDMPILYDSLSKELGNPEDVFATLTKDMDYNSFTGITKLGPINGMATIRNKHKLNVLIGTVAQAKFNDGNEQVTQIIESKVGSIASFAVKIDKRVSRLFTIVNPGSDLLAITKRLWDEGFFLNDWSRQYYIDNGELSRDFLIPMNILGKGMDNPETLEKFLRDVV